MNASQKLDQYLDSFRSRLRQLTLLQGAAATALVLLVLSGIGAWFSIESGFAGNTTNVFRVLLVLGLAAAVVGAIVDPLQRLRSRLSLLVERRVPGFDGRVSTYTQMKESGNPFLDLLAEDALKISATHPVEQQVPQKELAIAGGVLSATTVVFLWLLLAGPGLMNYSLRNLLAGWAFSDLLPPQSIVVTPGDESVRRGTNVRITSRMEGFSPDEAVMHIRNAAGEWQDVAMVNGPLGFEFTLFSMQQDTPYYISSNGLRSPEYMISVVDVPGIESLSLTYNYPEWTDRDPETFSTGDVLALPETRIALTITTTAPLTGGELVLNQNGQTMTLNGNQASGEFTVTADGEYYIAALVGDEQVRLSDDYFIRLTEDGKPEIKVVKPGGDWNASNIEEVLVRVEATDDYGLNSLVLHYSVNGGEFAQIDLAEEGVRTLTAEHMFMLEDMRTVATRAVTTNVGQFNIVLSEETAATDTPAAEDSAAAAEPAVEEIPLQPGDIISYYAEASDRTQSVQSDMFFIQIQPYNRRYSQSQLSGGGGGGGAGGGPQDEISQRQRQIIVSTWNLIREQAAGEGPQVEINSKLLSELQATLAEQAKTLADRTRARQLDRDEQIEEFVNNMDQAVQSMYPASERLASVDLNEAIQPAQEALQYLLRAESVFNDITLSQQQGGGGGGGGSAGQDLAEMFELEMDLELNQYETGNRAAAQTEQQQAEDIMNQLDDLARRQEELANNLRNQQQLTEAQRYQQEMLRREAEELQQQLDQLQRRQQGQQGQQQANSGQQGQQGDQVVQNDMQRRMEEALRAMNQSAESMQGSQNPEDPLRPRGQQGQGQQGQSQGQTGSETQEGEQIAQSELQRRMESAIRAMNQTSEAMQGNQSPEEMQRAAEEAMRQLQEARDQIARDQRAGMQESFANMAEQSARMLQDQQRMEEQLQQAMATAVAERDSGADPNSRGMTMEEEAVLAEQKRQLSAELQRLQQAMMDAQQNFGSQVPAAIRELQGAANTISATELEQAIADAALYIDAGYGLYIAGNEGSVTAGMRNMAEQIENANELVANAAAPGESEVDRARRQAQDLRAQLQQLTQNDPNAQQQDQQQQEGQAGQQGQQGGQQGGANAGNNNGGGRFGNRNVGGGGWDGFDDFTTGPIDLPDNFYDDVGNLTEIAREAVARMDFSPEELARMYDLIRELEFQQTNRNDSILAQQYGQMLALIEQLEAGLQTNRNAGTANVRTANGEVIPEEYKESVAEYFRRLSRE